MFRNNQKEPILKNDNTLETMLSFNYDEPIKEEVIFEDSDDEETRQLEMYIKQELCDEDIHSENIQKIGLTRSLSSKHEFPTNYRDVSNSDKCSISPKIEKPDCHEEHILNTDECGIEHKVEKQIDNVVAFSFEQIDDVITSSMKENTRNSPTCEGKAELHRVENIVNSTLANQTKMHVTETIASGPERPVQINFESVTSATEFHNIIPSLNTMEQRKGPPSYNKALFSSLLQTIIENLFMILPALNDYVKSINYKEEHRLSLKTRFEAVKYQYFSFCYSTIKTIILPHKKNKEFLNNFKKRVKIYADKRGMNTSEHNISLLCDELVCWAEIQKNKISFQEILSTKTLKQQPQNVSNRPSQLQTLLDQPRQSPSQLQTLLYQPRQSAPVKWNRKRPIQDALNFTNNNESNMKKLIKNITDTILTTNEQTQSLPTYLHAEQQVDYCSNNFIPNQTIQYDMPSLEESVTSSPPTQPPGKQTSYEGFQSPSQICQNTIRNWYPNTHQRMNPPQHYGSHELPPICAQERSISRDSGYLSPIGQQVLQNECSCSAVPEPVETLESRFPVIVKVTSMQEPPTNKTQDNGGYCQTCKTYTNMLCLGCHSIYYCSTACQNQHWKIHKFFCRY